MQSPFAYRPKAPESVERRLVTHAQWKSLPVQQAVTDSIHVSNIQAMVHSGLDVWGRRKQQRALISVTLSLKSSFDSAAREDALDGSTIHYGVVSKNIRAAVEKDGPWIPTGQLAIRVYDAAADTTFTFSDVVESTEVQVYYPKGSMHGDGTGYIFSLSQEAFSCVLHLHNVRVACIIGVNSNERLQRQPVVVNLWANCLPLARSDDGPAMEAVLVDIISGSQYETLETLLTVVMGHLCKAIFHRAEDEDVILRLRIEKPMAVPFADAPAVEIIRPVRVSKLPLA